MDLNNNDITKLAEVEISEEMVQKYFNQLVSGSAKLNLNRACTVGDGVLALSNVETQALIAEYNSLIEKKNIERFTPASGAATRMFKHLFDQEGHSDLVNEFLLGLENFAFYEELETILETKGISANTDKIHQVLSEEGLNYGKLPKALISFHQYPNEVRKAIDEQLVEGVSYVKSGGNAKFHFTISEEHRAVFEKHLEAVVPALKEKYNCEYQLSFSTQSKSTDTISLNDDGEVLRDENEQIIFRPGGHGALIHNLNKLESDVVFIKNIDNVVKEEFQPVVLDFKKVLGSILIKTQTRVFEFIEELSKGNVSDFRLDEITEFANTELNIKSVTDSNSIIEALNRPIRVCGMVKNEGKAGGGPFWVGDTVQIVESAQMDLSDSRVEDLLENASHFNPVDLVCGIKNYKGEKFDLTEFIDEETYFVSSKSLNGKEIKVLEHPGLWNGAMANWITIFVEVPVETFHPVKTVNDLLQTVHTGIA